MIAASESLRDFNTWLQEVRAERAFTTIGDAMEAWLIEGDGMESVTESYKVFLQMLVLLGADLLVGRPWHYPLASGAEAPLIQGSNEDWEAWAAEDAFDQLRYHFVRMKAGLRSRWFHS